jgi:hypothetical protein
MGEAVARHSLRPLLISEGGTLITRVQFAPRECKPMPSRCLTFESEARVTREGKVT